MSVMTLYPYLYQDKCWGFDDPQTGLKEEAFVCVASEMIWAQVALLYAAERRYSRVCSASMR